MSQLQTSPAHSDRPTNWIPGESGLWVLIIGDLFVFALFFGTFAYYRLGQPVVFQASQPSLNQSFGLLNTMLLLTSSWFVANAVHAHRARRAQAASRWTMAAMALGAGFILIKALEYGDKVHAGLTPTTNDFFMLYFVFTGIHLVHVVIGLAALALMRAWVANPAESTDAVIEGCAIFWHMVDVLWIVLFAIFYLYR